jgi:hypothetical protein
VSRGSISSPLYMVIFPRNASCILARRTPSYLATLNSASRRASSSVPDALGHMWPLVDGITLANCDKIFTCLGSDGSQQEGNDAEAARMAFAQKLNVKLLIDDKDVRHHDWSSLRKGLRGGKDTGGPWVDRLPSNGKDIDDLCKNVVASILHDGPTACELSLP